MKRQTNGFSDGRVHVTLLDGAFDLAALDDGDRSAWDLVLTTFRDGADLVRMEALGDVRTTGLGVTARLHHREPLASLYADLCRRVALEEAGLSGLVHELRPWYPEEARADYDAALGYHPTRRSVALAA
jgi:hypothetical protein